MSAMINNHGVRNIIIELDGQRTEFGLSKATRADGARWVGDLLQRRLGGDEVVNQTLERGVTGNDLVDDDLEYKG